MTPKFTLHGAIQTFHWKRPYEWKPGENTLLYMPLNGDVLDYSGNNNNGTWSGTTEYKTIGDKQYAYINTNSCIDLTSSPIGTGNPDDFTFSCWVRINENSYGAQPVYLGSDSTNNRFCLILNYYWSNNNNFQHINDIYWYTIYLGSTTSTPEHKGEWINVIYTYEKSTQTSTLYINNSQTGTDNGYPINIASGGNYRIARPQSDSNFANYGLSEIIFENGIWSEEDRTNYYNRSKVNYEPKPREPNANTIAYYPLTSNANDYSGNEYNATNYEGTFSTQNGGYFGTITSRLELPSMTIGQNFTISAWIKLPNGQPTGNQELDIYYDWSGSYRNILYACVAGGIICHTGNNATYSFTKTVSATFGTGWNNIILSKNGTSYSIYKNGVLLETFTAIHNVSIPGGNNTVYIGHTAYSTSEYSAFGYIKDYILENKARTSEDIANYYNQTKSNYGL